MGDLNEAARAYKQAVDLNKTDSYAHRRFAEMLLKGRGVQADRKVAVRHFYAAGEHGNSIGYSRLARFIFNGQFGLTQDSKLAFELYSRAHEMNSMSMVNSAAVALMLLQGIGVQPDIKKGMVELRDAISIYGNHKHMFDADECFKQIMAARSLSETKKSKLPLARVFLDQMSQFEVPGAPQLLGCCGGPLPPREFPWKISLSRILPQKEKGAVWRATAPVSKDSGLRIFLGQVEKLINNRWIATTEKGIPVESTFDSKRLAVEALATELNCDVPYVDRYQI
ncbi:MAG: tetratricopeptide repeat protein [Rhizobiaceae bacterium]